MTGRPHNPGTGPDVEPWWTDPANLADLVRWLAARDLLASDELAGVLEILDHPSRWTPEYEELRREERQASARPVDDDVSDEEEPTEP